MAERNKARAIALVGPNGSGKTTLMEALLFAAGAIDRKGAILAGTTTGDSSAEARARGQSVELNAAAFEFMGDRYTIIDLPGSIEFAAEADAVLPAMDLALIVADPDPDKAVLLGPVFRELDRCGVPRAVFINKIDQAHGQVSDLLAALQPMSRTPLVARQLPIWKDEHVTGFVDLALERAFIYRQGKESERIDIPADLADTEADARFHMLEQLSDFDDALMEQLLSDIVPERDAVFADLINETRQGLIAPVFFGSALNSYGMTRLLKTFRHDCPGPEAAAARLGADGACAYVLKTTHAGQAGKLALSRVLAGRIDDGADLTLPGSDKGRASGLFHMLGAATKKVASADAGEVVAIGKVEAARAGDLLSADGKARKANLSPARRPAVFAFAIAPKDRKDDVKLSSSFAKLLEEDPSLEVVHDQSTHEFLILGQGEGHLRVTLDRLKRRFGIDVAAERPKTAYRESIRKGTSIRGRHKKQTGGHGQFGDVVIEIAAQPRGSGFSFGDRITGGVVPKQWIPAVKDGVEDAMHKGPLGFPVTDVAVTLVDGSYHAVDSSELAFRTAGRIAMSDGLKDCSPYLLEPIEKLTVYVPSHATSKVTSIVSGRRGQILGFDAWDEMPGWDRIEAYLPHAERQDFIVELRSQTQGLGSFEHVYDHMGELSGKLAEEVAAKAAG